MKCPQFITVCCNRKSGALLAGLLVFGFVFDTATAETNQPPTHQLVQPTSDPSRTRPKPASGANARGLAAPGNTMVFFSTGTLGPISEVPHTRTASSGTRKNITTPPANGVTADINASVKPTTIASAGALGPISEMPHTKSENSRRTATPGASSANAGIPFGESTTNLPPLADGSNPETPKTKSATGNPAPAGSQANTERVAVSRDSNTNSSVGALESSTSSPNSSSASQQPITQPSLRAQLSPTPSPNTETLNASTPASTRTVNSSDSSGYPLGSSSSPVPSSSPIGPIVASVPSASISGNEALSPSPQAAAPSPKTTETLSPLILSESMSPSRNVSQDPSPSTSIGSPAAPTSIILFSLPIFALFLLAYVGLRCS
jgi:hypothetical protein